MAPRTTKKTAPPTEAGAPSAARSHPAPRTRAESGPAAETQVARIHEYIQGFHATHILAFGVETGAFAQIHKADVHGLSVDELSEAQGWKPDYARAFLEACLGLDVLELASEAGVTPRARYRFAPHMDDALAEETTPHYVGGLPSLHTLASLDYRRLPDLFRTGKIFPYSMHGEAFLRAAAAATRALPSLFVTSVLPKMPQLRARLEAGAHVLDVGCGAGWAVVEFSERFPKCRVVGVDAEPNAIEMAKTLLAFRQLAQRADVRLMRGEEIDYEAEFDLVTMFLVLRAIPPPHKGVALAHAARALKRGGSLLVFDEAYPDRDDDFAASPRRFNVIGQWLERPWGHHFATRAEHRRMLEEAGLAVESEFDEGRFYVVLARKP